MQQIVQISLDLTDIKEAIETARIAVEAGVDWLEAGTPLILINHFPLRQDLAVLPRVPRFSIWCGTRRTDDWHLRFNAQVVIYGHLHIPGTRWRDDVRFEEVSFGYPKQRKGDRPIESYLRKILPIG